MGQQQAVESKTQSVTHFRLIATLVILMNALIYDTACSLVPVVDFYSHSFVPEGLQVSYNVKNNISIDYNVTALIDFPGKLIFNFFVRRVPDTPGEPSQNMMKHKNMDFCKTIELMKNLTLDKEKPGVSFHTTFIYSCPLTQGFYYISNGTLSDEVVPLYFPSGEYWLQLELLQIFEEVTKLVNVKAKCVYENRW